MDKEITEFEYLCNKVRTVGLTEEEGDRLIELKKLFFKDSVEIVDTEVE